MTPDRVILRKVRSYDRELSIKWNAQKQWFELWRKPFMRAPQLITPITQSIYDTKLPRAFVPLDERLLWWIWEADTYAHGGPKRAIMESDSRWKEWQVKCDRQRIQEYRDRAKDFWTLTNSHYVTDYKTKNGKPKFENYEKKSKWVAPDVKARTSKRLFSRSRQNALKYNYQKPR